MIPMLTGTSPTAAVSALIPVLAANKDCRDYAMLVKHFAKCFWIGRKRRARHSGSVDVSLDCAGPAQGAGSVR
jgi:hypothetical protein